LVDAKAKLRAFGFSYEDAEAFILESIAETEARQAAEDGDYKRQEIAQPGHYKIVLPDGSRFTCASTPKFLSIGGCSRQLLIEAADGAGLKRVSNV
jgi:hypothetical protein